MTSQVTTVLLFTLAPVLASFVGSAAAAFHTPSERLRLGAIHLAAGLVLATAVVEMLPKVTHQNAIGLSVGFGAGFFAMLGAHQLADRLGGPEGGLTQWPIGFLAGIAIDLFVDGIILGIGFVDALTVGVLLTIAIAVEQGITMVTVAAILQKRGISRASIILVPTAMSLLMVVGAVVGTAAFAGTPAESLSGVLAFATAALLFLVAEDMMTEAHDALGKGESPVLTGLFFAGFLLFLIVDGLIEV